MDLSVLEKMSTEALCGIRDKAADILRERSSGALRVGMIGYFIDSRGNRRMLRVDRVNQKTVSGVEVDAIHHMPLSAKSGGWRVSKNLMTMIDTGPTKSKPANAAPSYVPKSTLDEAW